MGKIEDIREALATAMRTVPGLSTGPYVKDMVSVPAAYVGGPETIEYDKAFGRGHDDYVFSILVLAARVDSQSAQAKLDSFLDPYGNTSIKQAIEANGGSLGGVVDDARVQASQDYQDYQLGGVSYLGAVLLVGIMASGKP